MEKTILEWFEEAKANGAEWADNAINTTIELRSRGRLKHPVYSLSDALLSSFGWCESKDCHSYWSAIYDKIQQQEEQAKKNA